MPSTPLNPVSLRPLLSTLSGPPDLPEELEAPEPPLDPLIPHTHGQSLLTTVVAPSVRPLDQESLLARAQVLSGRLVSGSFVPLPPPDGAGERVPAAAPAGALAFGRLVAGDQPSLVLHVETEDPPPQSSKIAAYDCAVRLQAPRAFFIASPPEPFASPSARESFVSLLELADELDCTTAFLVVPQDAPAKDQIARIYGYLGFQHVSPRVLSIPGHLVLGMEL